MKKTLAIYLCLLFGFSLSLSAQQWRYGIKGGLNIAEIDDYNIMSVPEENEDGDMGSRLGFYGGFAVQYLFNSNWGIESGLYYSQLGGKVDRSASPKYEVKANASYLQLPIQAIYKFHVGNRGFQIYPAAGVYVGYGLGGKVKASGETGGLFMPGDYDYFDKTKRFDFGMALGLNFEYRNFVLTGSYDQGLIKVGDSSFNDNSRNSVMRVSLGYFF